MGASRLKGISETRSGTRSRLQVNESAEHDEHHHFLCAQKGIWRDDGSCYLCRWNSRSFPLMKLKFCRFMFISTFSSPFPWLSFVFVPSFKLLSLVRLYFFSTKHWMNFCCLYQTTIAELLRNVFCAYARLDPGPETKAKQIRWEKNFVRVEPVFPDCVLLSPYIKNSIENRFLCEKLRPNDSESGFNFSVTTARQSL